MTIFVDTNINKDNTKWKVQYLCHRYFKQTLMAIIFIKSLMALYDTCDHLVFSSMTIMYKYQINTGSITLKTEALSFIFEK